MAIEIDPGLLRRAAGILNGHHPHNGHPGQAVSRDLNDDGANLSDSHRPSQESLDRRSVGDRLIQYARAVLTESDFLIDQFGQAHVLVDRTPRSLPRGVYPWLRRLLYEQEGRGANGEALQIAAGVLEAIALHEGRRVDLHLRSAWHDGALFVELRPGRVWRIDATGHAPDPAPPVLFRRYANLSPMPDPVEGKTLDSFLDLILPHAHPDNRSKSAMVSSARRLLTSYIVAGLLPDVARPILLFTGPQGSGKTSRQRLIKWLLDPGKPESIRLDQRDFLQKAAHAHVLLLDNLNSLPDWAVDSLCRLVTGDADSKRVLYSDDADFIYELRRLVLINGINPPADRADFADRLLPIELSRIADTDRREELVIRMEFESQHAQWLGSVFTLLSRAMACRPNVTPERLPRLADWGRWVAAIYIAMGYSLNEYWTDWSAVVLRQHEAAIDGSPVAQVVIAFMAEREGWEGPPGQLHAALSPIAMSLGLAQTKDWPKDSRWLSRRLKELLPVLAEQGIAVTEARTGAQRMITLRQDRGAASNGDPVWPVRDPSRNDVPGVMASQPGSERRQADDDRQGDRCAIQDCRHGVAVPEPAEIQPRLQSDANDDIFEDTSAEAISTASGCQSCGGITNAAPLCWGCR